MTNFELTLPPPQSDIAREVMKDPYVFDFVSLGEDALERDLQKGLLEHIREFLIELGVGFAFVGSQYRLEVDGEDYYMDLLFYHLKLRAFVVIDLKTGKFKPEYAGKMNFYLSAVDDMMRLCTWQKGYKNLFFSPSFRTCSLRQGRTGLQHARFKRSTGILAKNDHSAALTTTSCMPQHAFDCLCIAVSLMPHV